MLSHWNFQSSFDGLQLAYLIAGIDPNAPRPYEGSSFAAMENSRVKPIYDRVESDWRRGTLTAQNRERRQFSKAMFDRMTVANWLDANRLKSEYSFTNDAPEPTPAPVVAVSDAKPWLSIDPQDPAPAQPWYTPARYFARQLAIDSPTLLANRGLLAEKVSTALFNAGFKKRGGKSKFDSGTVLKAFANVTLG